MITHLFFDIGGVLGTNGWDHEQRYQALDHFHLDRESFEDRHKEIVATLETGRITLDEYLAQTVFHQPRPFSVADFKQYMFAMSKPDPAVIELVGSLSRTGRWRLATLNNESEELNRHRLRLFGLVDIFSMFFSSCWLGCTKPARRIYDLALALSQADPASSVFVDDRERNLEPAKALGMRTILFQGAAGLRDELTQLGIDARKGS